MGLLDEHMDMDVEFEILNQSIRKSYQDLDKTNIILIKDFDQSLRDRMLKDYACFEKYGFGENKYKFPKTYGQLEDINSLKDISLGTTKTDILIIKEKARKLVSALKYVMAKFPEITFDEHIYDIINDPGWNVKNDRLWMNLDI